MNENTFFLCTKIIIKIKTRYKKKSAKKFYGGGAIFRWVISWVQFSGGQFSWGDFPGDIFPRGIFPRAWTISHPEVFLKILQSSQENVRAAGVCKMEDCNFIKKRLQYRSFSVNFAKFSRTSQKSFRTTASGNDPGETLAFWGNSLQIVSFLTRCKHYIIFRHV